MKQVVWITHRQSVPGVGGNGEVAVVAPGVAVAAHRARTQRLRVDARQGVPVEGRDALAELRVELRVQRRDRQRRAGRVLRGGLPAREHVLAVARTRGAALAGACRARAPPRARSLL